MVALLVLYMVDRLLLPGHVEHIAGFQALRSALESLAGPLSPQALASQIFGLYAGLVYFTPLLGGAIADRWVGQRTAVVIGALTMAAGHIAMGFEASFLLALLLLIVGSGFLKGNIAAQVGALYPPADEVRRTRGFVIFSTGINVGAVLGPLVCGTLAEVRGWHYGFGIAAVFMLLGLATYLHGYRYLPARVERPRHDDRTLTRADWRVIRALIAVIVITIFQSVAYLQVFNVLPVWIQQQVAASVAGLRVPVPWYLSVNSLFSIIGVPLLFWIWRRQAARGREPDDLGKIATGAWLAVASNLTLVAAIAVSGRGPVNPLWPLCSSAGFGIAFLYYWPTLLALVSQSAPPRVNATLMGIAYLSLFAANLLIGWIGACYGRMSPSAFWAMHAAIAAAGGLSVLLFRRRLERTLHSQ
jgi:proton-dependent oligopeptide transporter, POT family